ncbi:MAG TPA: response regulator [Polyangiales bacterium]|nr:response regulator [Polyangiales bacterium]
MKRIGHKDDPGLGGTPPRAVHREALLYVEDDDSNYRVAELRLSVGYALSRAHDAFEACRTLREHGSSLSAILMDIELRGSDLNGVELTKLIRGKPIERALPSYAVGLPALPNVPIIFVTAHGAKYPDAHLLFAGGDKVIPKPVDFAALNLALTQLHLSRVKRR